MLELNYSLVLQIVLFLGLWVALKRFWFEPTMRLLKERAKRSEGALAAARESEAKLEELRRQHHLKLQEARDEAQREVAELMRHAEAEQKQLIAQANEDAQRTLSEVRTRVAEDVAAARRTLSADVGAIATEVARRVLGRAV